MTEKPTLGPWNYHHGCVYTEDGVRLAFMDREESATSPCERDANARVMTASWEMLQALEELVAEHENIDDLPQGHYGRPMTAGLDMAYAAIAKAKEKSDA